MRAIAVTGYKNSGKTTLIKALALQLERMGLHIAIIKPSHHPLDKPDTDTGGFRAPGRTVVGMTDDETAIFWGEQRPITAILPFIHADIVLIEGAKHEYWLPRVLCLHNHAEAQSLDMGLGIATYGTISAPPLPHFTQNDIVALATLVNERAFALPNLDCGKCTYRSCHSMAQAVVAQKGTERDCQQVQHAITLHIDGSTVPMNPFVARMLHGAVQGMLQQMKGVGQGTAQITLHIN